MCTGAYGMNLSTRPYLAHQKGETEFDPTYNWVLNDQTIEGESGKTVWLLQSCAGNGKCMPRWIFLLIGQTNISQRFTVVAHQCRDGYLPKTVNFDTDDVKLWRSGEIQESYRVCY